ncbi:hypothetical protein GS397_26960 (plasmid) [Sphingobium yanoikuyae]|uniref:Uncharacterized protein n=1 Tax=Sphingobium yanoikuyae TaxID=13690 RepID=A0A6P1GQL0_SPHYA|nr:hypothetical protein [Sphingobium yanoikuyae]MCF8708922.1 hypothetical protein [Rhizorhapis sp. SPR117]QHD70748.1 hypothetical protein GS397_26960 [Sphingobium yanoikuyae]
MDATAILHLFQNRMGPLNARLAHGSGLSGVQLRKVIPQGMVFTGQYIPHLNALVKVYVDQFVTEGIVSARNDGCGSLIFVRPAAPFQ